MLRFDKITIKSQEFIQQDQGVESEHLLTAILEEPEDKYRQDWRG